MKEYDKGFNRGWGQIRISQRTEARERLMKVLGTRSICNFYQYKNGNKPNITALQAQGVERVFAEFGINEVWGV